MSFGCGSSSTATDPAVELAGAQIVSRMPRLVMDLHLLCDAMWEVEAHDAVKAAPLVPHVASIDPPRISRETFLAMRPLRVQVDPSERVKVLGLRPGSMSTKNLSTAPRSWGCESVRSASPSTGGVSPCHSNPMSAVHGSVNQQNLMSEFESDLAALLATLTYTGKVLPSPRAASKVQSTGLVARSGSDDDIESVMSSDSDPEGTDIIVGPTHLAVSPKEFDDLRLRDRDGQYVKLKSSSRALFFSDIQRLTAAPQGGLYNTLLSFGSSLHLNKMTQYCRPCMFERRARNCHKMWLCDFCHMHTSQTHKSTRDKKTDMKTRWARSRDKIEGASVP